MIFQGNHKQLYDSIEAIGAGFAIYEYLPEHSSFMLITCNSLYEDVLGKDKQSAIGMELTSIFPRYIAQPMLETFLLCKRDQEAVEVELLREYKGEERYWRAIISPILESSKNKLRIIQTCVNITEKKFLEKKLELTLKRFEAVVQSAYDGIVTIDTEQNIKLINQSALHIFGYTENEIVGKPLTRLLPQKYRKKHPDYVAAFKSSPVDSRPMESRVSVRGLRKDGMEIPVEVTISKIKVGENTELTAVIRDISEKSRLMEELLVAARTDPLTQVCNRRHFSEILTNEIKRYKRFEREFSLLMLDIDHFKRTNDQYGHEAGDKVLQDVCSIVLNSIRDCDSVGRWGGEEFLVLLTETSLAGAKIVAEKLRTTIEANVFAATTNKIKCTVSIGLQTYSAAETDLTQLINSVDKCLYTAKHNGRNCIAD